MTEVVDKSVFHPIHHTLTHTKITDFFYSHTLFRKYFGRLKQRQTTYKAMCQPFPRTALPLLTYRPSAILVL